MSSNDDQEQVTISELGAKLREKRAAAGIAPRGRGRQPVPKMPQGRKTSTSSRAPKEPVGSLHSSTGNCLRCHQPRPGVFDSEGNYHMLCSDCFEETVSSLGGESQAKSYADQLAIANQRQAEMPALLERIGVPHVLHSATLKSFDPDPDRDALEAARSAVAEISQGDSVRLCIYSEHPNQSFTSGNGKSHLLAAIAREVVGNPAIQVDDIRYVAARIVGDLKGLQRGEQDYVLQKLVAPRILLLDDVGAHEWTPTICDAYVQMLERRSRRSTIIACAAPPDDFVQHCRRDTGRDDARRVVDRISQFKTCVLSGPSRRKKTDEKQVRRR